MEKIITGTFLIIFLVLAPAATHSQASTKKATTKSKTTKAKSNVSSKTTGAGSPVTVKLVSKCEKEIMIYAGPKANLRNPKQRQVGGLSTNSLYLKTGDVVCIMDAKKKPTACMNVTKATLAMEINTSGTAITLP